MVATFHIPTRSVSIQHMVEKKKMQMRTHINTDIFILYYVHI